MLNTLPGLIVLLTPFLLIFCFTSRWRGFLYILSLSVFWHLFLGLTSQSLNIFSYELIFSLNLLVAIISIIYLIKKSKKKLFKLNLSYFSIFAFIIIFFELFSVHYFYTGALSTITGQIEKTQTVNPYPYFSDEWVGASIVNYSIENKSLPSGNPLVDSSKYNNFSNILIGFFSVISEIILLLKIPPLLAYPIMALGSGVLICFLVYTILKINGLNNISAALAALFVPLIVNSSNLPGLWYFIPFTSGLILLLVSLGALSLKDFKLFLFSSFLAVFLYPPIVIFIIASFLGFLINNQRTRNKVKFSLLGLLGLSVIGILIIVFQKSYSGSLLNLIQSTIFYSSLDPGIASYPIWIITPFILIPCSFLGLYHLYQKRIFFIIIPTISSLIFWLIYSQSLKFFIISYERTVVVSSILLIISAGFFWDNLLDNIKKKKENEIIILTLQIMIIISFSLIAWSYTENSKWEKLVLTVQTEQGERVFSPNPPASSYLTKEDLEIFKSIRNKRFISIPWKALVVGVTTNNYPMESKPSFISNSFISYDVFMRAGCKKKVSMAKKFQVDYVYSQVFNCQQFTKLIKSKEGLYLYKFNP